jgi:uncharacterized protein
VSLAPWILHPPSSAGPFSGTLAIFWHGAGGDIDQPQLKKVAQAFADRGAHAARARFGYRIAGKKMPDRMPVLIDSMQATIDGIKKSLPEQPKRLLLGGRSMGGRVASMLAAEGFHVDGLIFLGYPLHPDGKPQQLRDAHLPDVKAPMLFVQGDKDALCDLALLRPVLDRLGDRPTLVVIEKADHSFTKIDPDRLVHPVLEWSLRFARS